MISGHPGDVEVVKNMKDNRGPKFDGTIIAGNGWNASGIFQICGIACDGILISQAHLNDLKNDKNQILLREYRSYDKKLDISDPEFPSQITAQMFTAFQVIGEGIERVYDVSITNQSTLHLRNLEDNIDDVIWLRSALKGQIRGQEYDTALGKITIDEHGEIHQDIFCVAELEIILEEKLGRFRQILRAVKNCRQPQ